MPPPLLKWNSGTATFPNLWIPLIVVCLIATCLTVVVVILVLRDRKYRDQLESWKADAKEVRVFDADAGVMMNRLQSQFDEARQVLEVTATNHRVALEKLVETQDETTSTAYRNHTSDVEEFKEKLNTVLSALGKKLNEVLVSSENHTKATREHLDSLIPVLRKTEKENEDLREGYHRSLIDLAIQPILKIRDEVGLVLGRDASKIDDDTRNLLDHFDREMLDALHQLSIEEVPISEGQASSKIDSHLWEDLGVAVQTNDQNLHGCFASIRRKAYVLRGRSGERKPHVVRKALASQFRFSTSQEEKLQTNTEE